MENDSGLDRWRMILDLDRWRMILDLDRWRELG